MAQFPDEKTYLEVKKDYDKNVEEWKKNYKDTSWVGVDLDATLAEYDGWHGPLHIGKPIPVMVERIKKLIASGQRVKVFTARVSEPDEDVRKAIIEVIGEWTEKHIGTRLDVTNVKDYSMIECYDDRIKQVVPNKGVTIQEELVEAYAKLGQIVRHIEKILP